MSWNVRYVPELSALEVTYSGRLTSQELRASAAAVLEMRDGHATDRLLTDCSDLTAGGHTVVDLYELAHGQPPGLKLREAVILPRDSSLWGNVEFWEATCFNRGFDVHSFRDRASAVAWLVAG